MVTKVRKPLAIIAAVVLALLLAVSTAVPAFAAETADATPENGQQIVYEEPEFLDEENGDNYIILPDAPKKEGYIFLGWRVNGSADKYFAGNKVSVKAGEKVILTPIYDNSFRHACTVGGYYCLIGFFVLFILRVFGSNSRKRKSCSIYRL